MHPSIVYQSITKKKVYEEPYTKVLKSILYIMS